MKLNFTEWLMENEQIVTSPATPPTPVAQPQLPNAKQVMYTACVLHKYSQTTLVSAVRKWLFEKTGSDIPRGWIVRAHHMTVKFSPRQADIEAIAPMLGKEVDLQVMAWAHDEFGVAVAVKAQAALPLANDVPHVTVAHSREVGAVYSNTLLADHSKWIALEVPLDLKSELCCVLRDNVSTIPQLVNPASPTL